MTNYQVLDLTKASTNLHGNKNFKLKLNLEKAKSTQKSTLISFGGAYSNHISALAEIGKANGFKTVGIIRGEELGKNLQLTLSNNPSLQKAHLNGMHFKFISRETYRQKNSPQFIKLLQNEFPNSYIIPEGGTNDLAVKGCEEILTQETSSFNFICCPVGTGGTISGIINASKSHQTVLGFPALKGDFLNSEIKKYTNKTNWRLITDYHFGGYAKINEALVTFINDYKKSKNILLDPIYTAKMIFGLEDLIQLGYFPQNSRILAIHTGGLQGISGMNTLLSKKGLPTIEI
ncbi:1-aminocyclopropane-1-carboxylate deaminase/D-cysteine desulfhydrase [Croceibacter atlanticus]|jgi:1-aminocyclopropane-1-carboxylate deaminase|uniref:1-aminocyclopropane-1-carboxylate deaminase/D-cysteine desulfhydrase n=1 Tax=Croceibacter atlanticus TaxID=313588 RepID=UPI0024BB90A7|nr:pyridoxal-phosphate dependent enzyme [Croceibacter atlanticus]